MSLIAGNLGFIQRLFDAQPFRWAICAGAAAHLYGNRRPIQDVDLLVAQGKLGEVVKCLKDAQKAVQFDGQRIVWRGIKIFDDLTIRRTTSVHPFFLDELMIEHVRRLPLLGAPVTVLAPEDVLMHKLLLNRGASEGKHDLADAEGIVRRQTLDGGYLAERMQLMRASNVLAPRLADLGVVV